MIWQDVVLTIGQWIFAFALIPTIMAKEKPALSSSLLTAAVLTLFAVTYFSLSLIASGFSALLVAIAWYTLAAQKILQNRNIKTPR